MRIGIDVSPLAVQRTGVQTYILNAMKGLANLDTENDFFLYSNRDFDKPIENDGSRDGDIFEAINEHREQQEQGGSDSNNGATNPQDLRDQNLNSGNQNGGQESNQSAGSDASVSDAKSTGGTQQNQGNQNDNQGGDSQSGGANQQNGNQNQSGGHIGMPSRIEIEKESKWTTL